MRTDWERQQLANFFGTEEGIWILEAARARSTFACEA
jgi:hypothetical protein